MKRKRQTYSVPSLKCTHPSKVSKRVQSTGADAFHTEAFEFQVGQQGDQHYVVELLRMTYRAVPTFDALGERAEVQLSYGAEPSALLTGDSNVLLYTGVLALQGDTSGAELTTTQSVNFMCGDAGVLIACPRIHCSVDSVNTGTTVAFDVILWYRYKEVNVQEFIALRKSQYFY